MNKGLISHASVTVSAPIAKVWDALVTPATIKQYVWHRGSFRLETRIPIIWKGEYEGKKYEDNGVILKIEPNQTLQYSHFSPLSGQPDIPENYHIVTMKLSGDERQTTVTLSQDNNETEDAREHSKTNWQMMLNGLKQLLEK